jgi:hypothetical protein
LCVDFPQKLFSNIPFCWYGIAVQNWKSRIIYYILWAHHVFCIVCKHSHH